MSVRITFDIFSGRPNPVMTLNDADAKSFLDQLNVDKASSVSAVPSSTIESMLGYRGLVVEQIATPQAGLAPRFRVAGSTLFSADKALRVQTASLEDSLLANSARATAAGIAADLAALIRSEAVAAKAALDAATGQPTPSPGPIKLVKCPCAPVYEPSWWNDMATGGTRQLHNNCYNYACNYRSDTYAQPGRAGGTHFTSITCAGMKPAVQSDAIVSYATSTDIELQCPGKGNLTAMVIWPNWDFHWYRLGPDGFWTHKPGSNPVTNLDNSGHVIADPRTADRGRYTDFCSFMVVTNGHVMLK